MLVLFLTSVSFPFVLNYPASWAVYGESEFEEIQRPMQLERLDTIVTLKEYGQLPKNLNEGKQLIAFVTLTCPYCKRAAYRLHVLKKKYPLAPITIITSGDTADWDLFMRRSKIENVPHALMNHRVFAELSEGSVPKLFLIDEGTAIQKVQYWAIDEAFLEKLQ
jgi:glutaredoxin